MPPSTKESAIAGPALVAAAWPVSTKMPAPMMQPIPREIRLHAESVRFKGTPPWVTKAWTSVSSASALSTAIDFLAKIFDTLPPPYCPRLGFTMFLVRTCWAKLADGNTSPLSGFSGDQQPSYNCRLRAPAFDPKRMFSLGENVRFGSLADIVTSPRHVRFSPIMDIGQRIQISILAVRL